MSSSEVIDAALRTLGAFTLASVVALLLRVPLRRWCGAQLAFWLWSAIPLAMLVALWPHASSAPAWLSAVRVIGQAGAGTRLPVASGGSWRDVLIGVWLAGCGAFAFVGMAMQWRAMRAVRHARSAICVDTPMPVRHAATPHVGPALVGLWRPVIVLPSDMDTRFDAAEQRLIIAHETMHAQRRDACWHLLAYVLLALCWMHPLAWVAHAAFRRDLELACDAAVMRRHAGQRRTYANALIKDSSMAGFLPAGSTWSSTHPLTERIAMLKQSQPRRSRRIAGKIVLVCCSVILAGAVYAGTGTKTAAPEYQLDFSVVRAWDLDGKRHSERADLSLCMPAGEAGTVKVRDWTADAVITPQAGGNMNVTVKINDAEGTAFAQAQGALDQPMHSQTHAGKVDYRFDMTPRAGCPAREKTAHKA